MEVIAPGMTDRGVLPFQIRRNNYYDEITFFWCVRSEDASDQNGCYRP